jgi:lipopolysaccharide/colanic/teichoic acid biosynthesis glycosyltransferase
VNQNFYTRYGKRWFDIAASLAALIVLSPILAALAIAVRLGLGSPILFRQPRGGYRQGVFQILKFRTMTEERDASGEYLPDSARLRPIGRFLRATSLDELPELFNVLKGDMSLVGPRPLLTRYQPWYTPEESQRFEMRPGITGLAQINGRNAIGWSERFHFDVFYVQNCGFLLDFHILLRTVVKVLLREDVHVDTTKAGVSLDDERKTQKCVS